MRIMWLCNVMLPDIAAKAGERINSKEGWISGLYNRLEKRDTEDVFAVCCPVSREFLETHQESVHEDIWNVKIDERSEAFGFYENTATPWVYDSGMEQSLGVIFSEFGPDILHCFGMEYPHSLAAVKVFGRPDRTLLGIQGLCYALADAYTLGLPEKVVRGNTFRDWLKKDNIKAQQEKFVMRGENEKACIRRAGHVTGRTEWDKTEVTKVNPNIIYHAMNETMRSNFYSDGVKWQPKPHSIFVSQGDYPIKGVHFIIKAMGILKRQYSDITLTVAGNSIIQRGSLKQRMKLPSYGKYLLALIKENGLEGCVHYTGMLDSDQMKECYLKNSVFVCCSTLENSSNAVGEASLLKIPTVVACVGGLPSLLRQDEAFFYEGGNIEELAEQIRAVWEQPEEACLRAERAYEHAKHLYDADQNVQKLVEIYRTMIE